MTSGVLFTHICKIRHLCECLKNQGLLFSLSFQALWQEEKSRVTSDGLQCYHHSNSISAERQPSHQGGSLGVL